jgi:hypothetical protein
MNLHHGHARRGSRSRTHVAWYNMIRRCFHSDHHQFKNYGGRGITICKRWLVFDNFICDMGAAPKGQSLDRRDNEGNYTPKNCRWTTPIVQARNQRSNHRLTLSGRTMCVSEWAEELGLKRATLSKRLESGWSVERTLTTPLVRGRPRRETTTAAE